jgi:large subunit ribosomal protein L15
MQLHELQFTRRKKSQRIGRGGKRGSYSGRGVKGQRSRSGHKIRPAERDLIIRLPKLRGFANKPKSDKPLVLNLSDVARFMMKAKSEGNVINLEVLKKAGAASSRFKGEVKVLGDGDIKGSYTFEGFKVSKSAKIKIEKAGGKIM